MPISPTWRPAALLILTLAPACAAPADDPAAGPDASAGDRADAGDPPSSPDAGTRPVSDISAAVEPLRAAHDLVALGGAVVDGDGLVALGRSGLRRAGSPEMIEPGDKWHLGSNTKAMTATLAAILVEEGVIDWDTTAAEAFPAFAGDIHPQLRELTLVHLLSHRAGLPANPDALAWSLMPDGTPRAQRLWHAERLLSASPVHEPESAFLYSNAGFMVAGAMLEEAAAQPWEELLRERVFAPLGMDGCGFGPPGQAGTVDQPRGHRGAQVTPVEPGPSADNPPAFGPAGTVHCPLEDWAAFVALHLRGATGDTELLPQSAFARLHSDPGYPGAPEGYGYGYGWAIVEGVDWTGGIMLNHTGSNTMWMSGAVLGPARDRAYLMVTNQYSGAEAAINELYLQLVDEHPPR